MKIIVRRQTGPKLVIKKKQSGRSYRIDPAALLDEVRQASTRGATAREVAKKTGWEPTRVAENLLYLWQQKKIQQAWSTCKDQRTHYAAQESRYWLTGVVIPKRDD